MQTPSTFLMQVVTSCVALNKPREITFKGATDLVTQTDKAAEEAVLQVSICLVR